MSNYTETAKSLARQSGVNENDPLGTSREAEKHHQPSFPTVVGKKSEAVKLGSYWLLTNWLPLLPRDG